MRPPSGATQNVIVCILLICSRPNAPFIQLAKTRIVWILLVYVEDQWYVIHRDEGKTAFGPIES